MLRRAEDAEIDTAEQSAIKLRSQQQTSNALVVTDQRPPANGAVPVGQLSLVKVPSTTHSMVRAYYSEFFVTPRVADTFVPFFR